MDILDVLEDIRDANAQHEHGVCVCVCVCVCVRDCFLLLCSDI